MSINIKFFSLALFLISSLSSICKADFNQAQEAYQKKDYQTAFQKFSDQAEIGEVRSQLNLAVMYFYGQGVQKDLNKAYAWARIGTENDVENLDAKNKLAAIEARVVDKKAAIKVYESLAKKYSYKALFDSLYPVLVLSDQDEKHPDVTPLQVIPAKYPKSALIRGITGWVTFEFNLDPNGKVRNVKVIQDIPRGIFTKNALKAVQKWRFKPTTNKSGKPIWAYNVRYTMAFRVNGAPAFNKKNIIQAYKKAKTGNPIAQTRYALIKQNITNITEAQYPDNENSTAWYFKAARQGIPYAQFALGQSLIEGKGCQQDKSKGIQWLTRAAANGASEASEMLAQLTVKNPTREAQQQAINFFNESKKTSASAQIQFAWVFATSPFQDLRDPDRAIKIVKNINRHQYNDSITKDEILAAAYAAKDNFKKAISYQEDALDDAEDDDYYMGDLKQHLADYKQHKTWF